MLVREMRKSRGHSGLDFSEKSSNFGEKFTSGCSRREEDHGSHSFTLPRRSFPAKRFKRGHLSSLRQTALRNRRNTWLLGP